MCDVWLEAFSSSLPVVEFSSSSLSISSSSSSTSEAARLGDRVLVELESSSSSLLLSSSSLSSRVGVVSAGVDSSERGEEVV